MGLEDKVDKDCMHQIRFVGKNYCFKDDKSCPMYNPYNFYDGIMSCGEEHKKLNLGGCDLTKSYKRR